MAKNWLDIVALVLVIIGAINWGLIGLSVGNVVEMILGSVSWLLTTVYVLVGLAGLYTIYVAMK